MAVKISGVEAHSIAQRHGIKSGDVLLKIGEEEISDVLDYRFYMTAKRLTLSLSRGSAPYSITVKKDEYDDLGLEFETYLMDKQRSCRNNCIFCFIDQNPQGMRESIYFKDDDDRLSFLFGNYITLTNLSDHDVDRILRMHISPINISVHTTDPELRVKMMRNRFAGSSLQRLYRLCEGNIKINTQLVLCPGYNDGTALERTLSDLDPLVPKIQSIACVPVGLTAYRDGLQPQLRPFTQEEAAQTIDTIEKYADRWFLRHGMRVGYPADEFFLLAKRPIPPAEYYGDFANLENGVGLIANTELEFCSLLPLLEPNRTPRQISVATGVAAGDSIKKLCAKAQESASGLKVEVFPIPSRFFGGRITVTGLVTGSDIITELKGRPLGDLLIIPSCMLRREQDKFLDDTTPEDVSKSLGIPVKVVQDDGASLAEALVE